MFKGAFKFALAAALVSLALVNPAAADVAAHAVGGPASAANDFWGLISPAAAQTAVASSPDAAAGLWGWFSPTVFTAASAAVGVAITWAAVRFHAVTGIQIDQKYQDDLHRAADTGIHLGLSKAGVMVGEALSGNTKLAAIGEAMKWVNSSVPQALGALGVTPDQVRDIVTSKLSKVMASASSATAVVVAPAAGEIAKAG